MLRSSKLDFTHEKSHSFPPEISPAATASNSDCPKSRRHPRAPAHLYHPLTPPSPPPPPPLPHSAAFFALTFFKIDPPPVIMDDDGQIQHEEDREVMGGVRLIRTLRMFKDEWFLITVGFLIIFFQVLASTYLPQLNKVFNDATSAPPPRTPILNIFPPKSPPFTFWPQILRRQLQNHHDTGGAARRLHLRICNRVQQHVPRIQPRRSRKPSCFSP
jgi:hypothetical protein